MRTSPYRLQLTVEDRKAVARWRRNLWIGYAAVAVILMLGSVAFASDPEDYSRRSSAAPVQVDNFGVDEIVKALVPELDTAAATRVSGPPASASPQATQTVTERDPQLRQAAGVDSKPER